MKKFNFKLISIVLAGFVLVGCSNNKKESGNTTFYSSNSILPEETKHQETDVLNTTSKETSAKTETTGKEETSAKTETTGKEETSAKTETTSKEASNKTETTSEEASTKTETTSKETSTKTETASKEETVTAVTTVESQNDNIVVSNFNELKKDINELLSSENVENIKENCKEAFVTMVDFIFFDGDIKGIKFDDLSDAGKKEVLSLASSIDDLIMKKFPNYKEEISDVTSSAYNKASELIKKGSTNVKDFAKEKLGEDNYNKIKSVKDSVLDAIKNEWNDTKEDAGELIDTVKDKIKNWYLNWK